MIALLLAFALAATGAADAQDRAGVLLFNAPPVVEQGHVDALWEFVQELLGRKDPAPEVYFPAEDDPPVTSPFLGFYYEHTSVIRVAQRAWREGVPGKVYLILGHEMLHYALVGRVPITEHHCLFERERYETRLAVWLVSRGVAHPFLAVEPRPGGCVAEVP